MAYEMSIKVNIITESENMVKNLQDKHCGDIPGLGRCFAYSEGYEEVRKEVQELSLVGAQVVFNSIRKVDNPGAIMLALGSIVEKSLHEKEIGPARKEKNLWNDYEEVEDEDEGGNKDEDEEDVERGYEKKEPSESSGKKGANQKRRILEWAAKTQVRQEKEEAQPGCENWAKDWEEEWEKQRENQWVKETQMIYKVEREAEESKHESEKYPKWKQEIVEWVENVQMACAEEVVEVKRKREQNMEQDEVRELESETKKRKED